ncbi:hypothetical protein [Protaetiibacter intestinalis]|uniref:Uncharacterized protein n=1 Tax=Protaetiibacter intestinalis TaxID=2419774 RepID=A0A387B9P4_9MICO|nr:hypothetical protein [Protaetiibacter intestinalis]AYF98478.1 hypothetical protein D7I47_09555 [Protaetiibacter intestinalis]
MTAPSEPQPADRVAPVRLSPWVLGGVAVAATAAWVLNLVGGLGFPDGAPAEWGMNAVISIDLVGVAIATGVGALVAARRRPSRESRVLPWLGVGLALVAAVAWAATSPGLWQTLFAGRGGRYAYDVGGVFFTGIAWALGAVFGAFGYRTGGLPIRNAAALAGIVLWAIVAAGAVGSALLYAADLTD